ncbi:MAG: N-acetyltransferase [Chloroflexi bacterium]|nr:MAG: N-acetyltransferase [Chloroflexota bacterium]
MEDLVIVNNLLETRFQAVVGGHLALLEYQVSEGVFQIDYVYVPAAYRGRGIAGQLMEAALAYSQSAGLRVNPICSYARAYIARKA